MKRLITFFSTLFMSGCAYLMNSDRPKYTGPIVEPLWHVEDLAFDGTPLIHDGGVYVRGRGYASQEKHVYAFDLKTGRKLWTSKFIPEQIKAAIGPLLFVTDGDGSAHVLNAKTGEEAQNPFEAKLLSAAVDGQKLYAVWSDHSVSALDSHSHVIWRADAPMDYISEPVVLGDAIYVAGRMERDNRRLDCRIYAYDAKSGTARWHWTSGTEGDQISTISADASGVYGWYGAGMSGTHFSLNASDGKVRWTRKNRLFAGEAPVLMDDSTVVVRDIPPEGGKGFSYHGLKRATGEQVWESATSWQYDKWTEHNGLLFAADRQVHALLNEGGDTSPDSWLTVCDLRSGQELWRSPKIQLGDFTMPAVGEGMVVVGSWPYQFQNPKAAPLFAFRASKDGK